MLGLRQQIGVCFYVLCMFCDFVHLDTARLPEGPVLVGAYKESRSIPRSAQIRS